jgi:hypothetical protein
MLMAVVHAWRSAPLKILFDRGRYRAFPGLRIETWGTPVRAAANPYASPKDDSAQGEVAL